MLRFMDLSFTAEEEAFRKEVRAWIASAMPPHLEQKSEMDGHFTPEEMNEWHRILAKKGWAAPHWPTEHGGPGFTANQRFILGEELELAGTPTLSPFGLMMVGPLIIQFGSDEQKKRFLPKILSGEEVWCQGYSEPGSGSDLASLSMRAEDAGDHFVVNGQKTWTTYAQYADWIFCLVRTDPSVKKQAGISFLLIDMKSPGVEAKPMLTIGHTPAFCDTFFENVKVPKAHLVGPLNAGWGLAKALLGHERTMIAAVGQSRRAIRRLKRIAAEHVVDGAPLLESPAFRAKIARAEMRLRALQMANYRALAGAQLGHAPGPESSILKIVGSHLLQDVLDLGMEVMGHDQLSWFNEPGVIPAQEQWWGPSYCYARATTIYGGSNEIQKNVIAKWILQLPGGKN
jgi:alkylation response protein AidB-like acyl-CoA dehydrogenase